MTAFRLSVPDHLQRNSKTVTVDGIEETGSHLIRLGTERLGLTTLASSDILDVGCGVRFAQALVNRDIPVRSYTGIEVDTSIVDFMRSQLEPFDARFRFVHWNVRNDLYNGHGDRLLSTETSLPVTQEFDVIWLFSVFTHLDRVEAAGMLKLLRRVIRPSGGLLFTAFVDPALDGVENRQPARP